MAEKIDIAPSLRATKEKTRTGQFGYKQARRNGYTGLSIEEQNG